MGEERYTDRAKTDHAPGGPTTSAKPILSKSVRHPMSIALALCDPTAAAARSLRSHNDPSALSSESAPSLRLHRCSEKSRIVRGRFADESRLDLDILVQVLVRGTSFQVGSFIDRFDRLTLSSISTNERQMAAEEQTVARPSSSAAATVLSIPPAAACSTAATSVLHS